MPPQVKARPSRRSARASTRDSPPASVASRRTSRQQGLYEVTESPSLRRISGTHPMHDGSYGTNTFEGLDAMELRGKRRLKKTADGQPYVNEEEDDAGLDDLVQSELQKRDGEDKDEPGGRRRRQRQAFKATIDDAARKIGSPGALLAEGELEFGFDGNQNQLPNPKELKKQLYGKENRANGEASPSASLDPERSDLFDGDFDDDTSDMRRQDRVAGRAAVQDSPSPGAFTIHNNLRAQKPRRNIGPLGPLREPLNPNQLPYSGDLWSKAAMGLHELKKATLPNLNLTPFSRRRGPSEPPTSLASKYGIPAGRASSVPLSERSFNYESILERNARIRTPGRTPRQPSPVDELAEEDVDLNSTPGRRQPQTRRPASSLQVQETYSPQPPRITDVLEHQERPHRPMTQRLEPRSFPDVELPRSEGLRRRARPSFSPQSQHRSRDDEPVSRFAALKNNWQDLLKSGLVFVAILLATLVGLGLLSRLTGHVVDPQSDEYTPDGPYQSYSTYCQVLGGCDQD